MTAYVYLLRDREGTVVYVGVSKDVERRVQEHRRDSLWRDDFESVEIALALPDWDEAHEREVAFIRAYRPRWNTANNHDSLGPAAVAS